MLVELLSVRTDDGCLLDAAYWPAAGAAPSLAEALVLIHGVGGNGFAATQRGLAVRPSPPVHPLVPILGEGRAAQ